MATLNGRLGRKKACPKVVKKSERWTLSGPWAEITKRSVVLNIVTV